MEFLIKKRSHTPFFTISYLVDCARSRVNPELSVFMKRLRKVFPVGLTESMQKAL